MGVGTHALSCDRSAAQPDAPPNRNVGPKLAKPLAESRADLTSVLATIIRAAPRVDRHRTRVTT